MLNKRLLKLRKEHKLTQQELSSRLGIARTTYSGYELGTSEPDNVTIGNIADFYDVSIDYLLGRTDDPKRILKEQARQLIDMIDLDLTDEQIMSKMDLYVDGQIVEQEEVRIFISLIRANRIRMKQGLASTENKQ